MFLTIATIHQPATDLGYLLHKNPSRVQTFDLTFGRAHVFYPVATDDACTAAMLVEVDSVGLVRNRRSPAGDGFALKQYVNDRPYAASSFLSVAISRVFGTARSGRCKDRPELAESAIPLTATVAALPCRGGESTLLRLFEPLGYQVTAESGPLDPRFPEWGDSPYLNVTLGAMVRLSDLLSHLYVLIPVLDDEKHYWVDDEEVDKLLRHGGEWLKAHPEREFIVKRYLRRKGRLTREALLRLSEDDGPEEEPAEGTDAVEAAAEAPIRLNDARMSAVVTALKESGARRVLDVGCGEGRLLRDLLADPHFTEIAGMDVSLRALDIAEDRLRLDQMAPRQRERLRLMHGSLVYRDARLAGFDAAATVEVIEHLDPSRLAAFERVLFEFARPGTVILTTPNAEYNAVWESLPAGDMRHRDHRFEWTRAEFTEWARQVADRHGYSVTLSAIGPEAEGLGSPSQMAVFARDTKDSSR